MAGQSNGSTQAGPASALASVIGSALRGVNVPRMQAATGSASAVGFGRVTFGDATIEKVVLQGLSARVDAGRVLLDDVRSVLDLRVGLSFRLRAGPFRAGGAPAVTMSFPFDIGSVDGPALEPVELSNPSAVFGQAHIDVSPITNLNLGAAHLAGIAFEETRLTGDGAGCSGLALEPVRLRDVTLQGVSTARVTIAELSFSGSLPLPAIDVREVSLPTLSAEQISSRTPVDIENASASRQSRHLVDLGFLRISVFAEPTLHLHIGALTLNDLSIAPTLETVRLEDMRAPMTVRDVEVGDLMLKEVTVNQVTL